VIYRLLVLLSWTCEAEGAYVRSEASISSEASIERGLPLTTQQHHEHHKALWDGFDVPTEVLAALSVSKVLHTQKTSTSVVKWGLLGPFDSGTNLFRLSVNTNFPQLKDAPVDVWKHSLSGSNAITTAYQQHMAPLPLKSMVLVMMVRSPLSQISSWKKAPYNLGPCVADKAYADMSKACQARMNCMQGLCGEDDPNLPFHSFASVADIYNQYLHQYQQLQKENKFKHIMLVTYEDLVLNPQDVMKKFAHAMDFVVAEQVVAVDEPSKDHGDPVGRAEALAKLKSRPWLAEMGSAGLQAICPQLSKELIGNFKEGNYVQDCRDHSK